MQNIPIGKVLQLVFTRLVYFAVIFQLKTIQENLTQKLFKTIYFNF